MAKSYVQIDSLLPAFHALSNSPELTTKLIVMVTADLDSGCVSHASDKWSRSGC